MFDGATGGRIPNAWSCDDPGIHVLKGSGTELSLIFILLKIKLSSH